MTQIQPPEDSRHHAPEVADKPPVVLLMGPTASGKTDLAIRWHEEQGAELVSVDSALIYRGMDIGTAKPSAAELARAPHRLIDFLDPLESYSAAEFRRDALAHIAEIQSRGKMPLLVGGTMMYFKRLLEGVAELPAADAELRAELEARIQSEGLDVLHAQLARLDPATAQRIRATDPQRLTRALEVCLISGRPMSELLAEQPEAELPFHPIAIALAPHDRAVLHERIETRFDQMLEQGFIAEVEALKARPELHAGLPSIRCVGYRQVWDFLDGHLSRDEMRERGIIATRQLAKRQLTWLRSWQGIHPVDSMGVDPYSETLKIVRQTCT
ncbi:tRNA (adenosine(37)-N6)-dimethylallyltransferase MiaA [Cobetia sp. cqz5-12]|uniref:tRNA (adenosine(37)-N6)-dimethylallyltransferase MiaA n=1 Tax=Cobetia sp. cqz5-12 TaxID=2609415 RepID=UPI001907E928|nr:tRNA (adenosine(37)-N6)-dimethylallyltransferase MiaA [Cobetia sp. cqz5-12]